MYRFVKRGGDIVGSLILLLLLSPILLVVALMIVIDSGLPVFFSHERIGLRGKPFAIIKFRTMLPADPDAEAGWQHDWEARITRAGRLLRRFSLDELPQLFNVLTGDMSLVGPRPTLRAQVEAYTERERHRLDVRPGITGWAQVNGRNSLMWAERIELDLWYVENLSAWVDLRILARTPGTVLGAKGLDPAPSVSEDAYRRSVPLSTTGSGAGVASARLLDPSDQEWRDALSEIEHDIYHLPEYSRVSSVYDGGRAAALYVESGDSTLLIPLVIKDLPPRFERPELFDALTPYGYASPITNAKDPERIRELLRCGLDTLAESGCVSLFARLHPLLGPPAALLGEFGDIVPHGETVYLDLEALSQEPERTFRSGHRADIERARRLGYTTVVDDWVRYGEFHRLYSETMARVGAAEYYFFPADYFAALRKELGELLHIVVAVSPEGEVASAGLFFCCEGIVQYHLSVTSESHLAVAPSKLMLAAAVDWAKSSGARLMHLGGGVGGEHDGLFRFKAGFSELRAEFATWRCVTNASEFSALNDVAGKSGAGTDGFFPPYRG